MLNVNISTTDFMDLKEKDYIIEQSNDILTIRNAFGKPLAEVVYFTETNEVLLITEETFEWGQSIRGIGPYWKGEDGICIVVEKHVSGRFPVKDAVIFVKKS